MEPTTVSDREHDLGTGKAGVTSSSTRSGGPRRRLRKLKRRPLLEDGFRPDRDEEERLANPLSLASKPALRIVVTSNVAADHGNGTGNEPEAAPP